MSDVTWEDNYSHYEEMILDADSHNFGLYSQSSIEVPNPRMKDFIVC